MGRKKGFRHPEKTKRKMREARKGMKNPMEGKCHSIETRKKISESLKGRKLSEEHKKRISEVKKRENLSKETIKRMSEAQKGIKHSKKTRRRMSKLFMGEKSSNWKGGVTPENEKIRHDIEYRLWREAVFARDGWTCQKTGVRGGCLNAHHIQNFSQYPELRTSIDNGITLSKKAHIEFHKIYGKQKNTKEQMEEFLLGSN